jgi:hypothetical protein
MYGKRKPNFYKLFFRRSDTPPPDQIYLFHKGMPLYTPATFRDDRYVFVLPKNLEDKMLAGALVADFSYTELSQSVVNKHAKIPVFIVLSDRYE